MCLLLLTLKNVHQKWGLIFSHVDSRWVGFPAQVGVYRKALPERQLKGENNSPIVPLSTFPDNIISNIESVFAFLVRISNYSMSLFFLTCHIHARPGNMAPISDSSKGGTCNPNKLNCTKLDGQ